MVTHLVLLKLKRGLSQLDRQAFATAFEHAVTDIPTVRGVRIGTRIAIGAGYEPGMPDTADYVAAIDFDDQQGLGAYLEHPVHQELARLFWSSLSGGFVFDFEMGGLELLSRLTSMPEN
jgi:hypothetical protein